MLSRIVSEVVDHGHVVCCVFSLDVTCTVPMRPEFMTRRMRAVRSQLGIGPGEFDATILVLRKWTNTELMDAGFNPSAVSDRQGHTVQVMVHHYSSRRRSARPLSGGPPRQAGPWERRRRRALTGGDRFTLSGGRARRTAWQRDAALSKTLQDRRAASAIPGRSHRLGA